MNQAPNNDPFTVGKLAGIEKMAASLADDLRPHGGDLRCARAVLLALQAAIRHDSLESLAAVVGPWLREQVTQVDALREAAAFDELSAVVSEMALPDEDWVEHGQRWNDKRNSGA